MKLQSVNGVEGHLLGIGQVLTREGFAEILHVLENQVSTLQE